MKKLTYSAIIITILLLLSKVLGLFREIVLADKFGASSVVDAYTIAISLPSVIFTVFASGFSNSYIPTYSRVDKSKKDDFFNITITVLTLVSLFFSFVCFYFSELIVKVIAPGFRFEDYQMTVSFVRIISCIFPFMTVFNILSCQSQVKEHFIFVSFCDYIVINLVVIFSIYLAALLNTNILIYGYVFSMILATVLMGFYAKKYIINSYHFSIDVKNSDFYNLVKLAIPLGLSLVVNQLNAVVDKMFSSSMGEGITSALSYANRIQLIPFSLAVSVVLTVFYPRISHCFAYGNMDEGVKYLKESSLLALFIGIPVVGALCFFSEPVVRILFERGAFDAAATAVTSRCLLFYSIGIPFYSLREIASKALAANTQQKAILKNTIITFIFNIVLDCIFVQILGYRGLALATSISGLISFLLMYRDLTKQGIMIFDKHLVINTSKIFVDTVLCVLLGLFIFNRMAGIMSSNISIVITMVFSGLLYILVGYILKISVANQICIKTKSFINRR